MTGQHMETQTGLLQSPMKDKTKAMQERRVTVFLVGVTVVGVAALTVFSDQRFTSPRIVELLEESGPGQVSREEPPQGRPPASLTSVYESLGNSAKSQSSSEHLHGKSASHHVSDAVSHGSSNQSRAGLEKAAGQVMRERAAHMARECRRPEIKQLVSFRPRNAGLKTVPFPICFAPKAGSTTWRNLMDSLGRRIKGSRKDMKTLVVRHPLARLASVYRDKYLNGSPLTAYNSHFKMLTGSRQTWQMRWQAYWLPILINKGLVKPSPQYMKTLAQASAAYQYLANKLKTSNEDFPGDAKVKANSTFSGAAIRVAKRMHHRGRHEGLAHALKSSYSEMEQARLMKRFHNASFTMTEFLEHVLWTRDVGVVDPHWTPISELCDPCGGNYRYVLHLENPEESTYLLGLLHTSQNTVPRRHKSIGATRNLSDLRYYKTIPQNIVAKIVDMYKMEFELFGYEENRI